MVTRASFQTRFDAMVAELKAHPGVKVFKRVVKPPASAAALRAAEKAVGSPLPDDVKEFYAAHNGVFLEWGLRGGEYERTRPFDSPDYGSPPGCINILPVQAAMSPEWERCSHVNAIGDAQLRRLFGARKHAAPPVRAVCIDNYSMYNHGDLVFGPAPVMVVSTDHGADMDSSDFMDFSTYLDLTLAIYGVDRYARGVGGEHKPRRVKAWTRQKKLDKLVAELAEDAD